MVLWFCDCVISSLTIIPPRKGELIESLIVVVFLCVCLCLCFNASPGIFGTELSLA